MKKTQASEEKKAAKLKLLEKKLKENMARRKAQTKGK
jgi:hypothetical protein